MRKKKKNKTLGQSQPHELVSGRYQVKRTYHEAPFNIIFSVPLLLHVSRFKIFSSAIFFQIHIYSTYMSLSHQRKTMASMHYTLFYISQILPTIRRKILPLYSGSRHLEESIMNTDRSG